MSMTDTEIRRSKHLTPELCRALLDYDPETGLLHWKSRKHDYATHKSWNRKYAGTRAFTSRERRGYLRGSIFGNFHMAHRVAWIAHYGKEIPDGMQIDHIDGNRENNRIDNLRLVTPVGNSRNMRTSSRNKSGCVGVAFSKRECKWRAYIYVGAKQISLGTFDKVEGAVEARKAAEAEYGFHPNHGRPASSRKDHPNE